MGKIQEKGKEIAEEFFKEKGYSTDRYGNMKSPSGKYRVKFNKNKMRYERLLIHDNYPNEWMRLYSLFWKDIKGPQDLRWNPEN